ncbi:probable palmitoyltransferase ZDHHC11 isoform X5 [Papio anubis]|uniref:probable palmitoyltransferase ZDHHC11 isoform X5 n=1 Tax=Papio anubis TaxID=9555 RepID=UPI0012AD7039|nr:probable palmitoyltransferase ZDHHC11 isoform X5 [Papio anubis]
MSLLHFSKPGRGLVGKGSRWCPASGFTWVSLVNARDSLQIYRRPSPFSSTVHPEGGSTAREADDEPSLSSLGSQI